MLNCDVTSKENSSIKSMHSRLLGLKLQAFSSSSTTAKVKFLTVNKRSKDKRYPRIIFDFLHLFPSHGGYWFPSTHCSHKIRIRRMWTLIAANTACPKCSMFAWLRKIIHRIFRGANQTTITFVVVPFSSLGPLPLQMIMLLITVSKAKEVLSAFDYLSVEKGNGLHFKPILIIR